MGTLAGVERFLAVANSRHLTAQIGQILPRHFEIDGVIFRNKNVHALHWQALCRGCVLSGQCSRRIQSIRHGRHKIAPQDWFHKKGLETKSAGVTRLFRCRPRRQHNELGRYRGCPLIE